LGVFIFVVREIPARCFSREEHMPKRIIVAHYGGPETLQVVEEECAEPKRGEVRVRVLAAGVSLPDILAREVFTPKRQGFPSRRGGT
jgi:NADPH:quinone reductase-like Zn-dependent oxidoreductase